MLIALVMVMEVDVAIKQRLWEQENLLTQPEFLGSMFLCLVKLWDGGVETNSLQTPCFLNFTVYKAGTFLTQHPRHFQCAKNTTLGFDIERSFFCRS